MSADGSGGEVAKRPATNGVRVLRHRRPRGDLDLLVGWRPPGPPIFDAVTMLTRGAPVWKVLIVPPVQNRVLLAMGAGAPR